MEWLRYLNVWKEKQIRHVIYLNFFLECPGNTFINLLKYKLICLSLLFLKLTDVHGKVKVLIMLGFLLLLFIQLFDSILPI